MVEALLIFHHRSARILSMRSSSGELLSARSRTFLRSL
jgi:hypothetical protein